MYESDRREPIPLVNWITYVSWSEAALSSSRLINYICDIHLFSTCMAIHIYQTMLVGTCGVFWAVRSASRRVGSLRSHHTCAPVRSRVRTPVQPAAGRRAAPQSSAAVRHSLPTPQYIRPENQRDEINSMRHRNYRISSHKELMMAQCQTLLVAAFFCCVSKIFFGAAWEKCYFT